MSSLPVFLLEPHAGGRISGGYQYNIEMARHAPAIARRAVRPDHLAEDLEALRLPEPAWLLADSLFLTPEHMPAVQRYCRHHAQRLGVVLHAFPSFIQRASDREQLSRALPLRANDAELAMLEQIDVLVAPGPYIPRLLADQGCAVRTLVCPPGVERLARTAAPRAAGPVELVSIASVTPLKGFLDAVEALARCGTRDFRWTIIGHLGVAPEYVARLRERADALGLAGQLRLAGQLEHEQTLAALAASDALLVTSFTENHPLVALEALVAHVPTLGYAVGGLPDIIRHERSGLLAPLLDVGALAALLGRAIGDTAERARLSRGCAEAAAALPSWSETSRQLVSGLQALTA